MQQPEDIERQLDAVQEHVEQCRAALAIAREGDPSAMQDLSAEVDLMAAAVAELKATSSAAPL
jgi:hypothetical protein